MSVRYGEWPWESISSYVSMSAARIDRRRLERHIGQLSGDQSSMTRHSKAPSDDLTGIVKVASRV